MKKTVATFIGVIAMVVALHAFRALHPQYAKAGVSIANPVVNIVTADNQVDTVKTN